MDYEDFLSDIGKRTTFMVLRQCHTLVKECDWDLVNLAPSVPDSNCFPLESVTIKLKDGSKLELESEDLTRAQQYSANEGCKEYEALRRRIIKELHDPPCWDHPPETGGTMVLGTTGCSESIMHIMYLTCNQGDTVLLADVVYPGFLTVIRDLNLKPVPIATDDGGIIPEALRQVMSSWDPNSRPGSGGKPKILYTIPNGQNPTGSTLTLERRQEIYRIAQQYNFLIFEDDPYWLASMDQKKRIPSFLSMDTDGRVVRADTFSKTLVPGFRAGYLSGPAPLLRKVYYRLGSSTHGTGTFVQFIIVKILEKWGIDGFLERNQKLAKHYGKQRDMMVSLANKWLNDLVEYKVPSYGLHLWMKIKGVEDTKELCMEEAFKNGVLVAPGSFFYTTPDQNSPYVRVTYSCTTEEKVEKGFQRLAESIRKHLQK